MLSRRTCVIFVNGCNVEELKYAFGKKVTYQNLIVKCWLLIHGCKVKTSHEHLNIKQENIYLYYKF